MDQLIRIAHRLRHAGLRNSTLAIGARVQRKMRSSRVDKSTCDDLEAAGLAASFLDSPCTQHFLHEAAQSARLVGEQFPDARNAAIESADAICAHRFEFLGKRVTFGDEIDWLWCPESGGSWPTLEQGAAEQTHFGEERPGDIKYPWELNRHQYFTTLGKGFLYTHDERYAEEFVNQLKHWQEKNPCGQGHNWLSALELGIRIISWTNAMWLFRGSTYFRAHGFESCALGLYDHARMLSQKLTTYWLLRNNHLIGEAAGLFMFSVLFPMWPESTRWQKQSLKILAGELRHQVFADGVNKEQATGYHRFVLEFLMLTIRIADLNDVAIPPILRQRKSAILNYLDTITAPDGTIPQVGDCDDGRAISLTESIPYRDTRGLLAAGFALEPEGASTSSAPPPNEETIWLLGPDNWPRAHKSPHSKSTPASAFFPDGGQAVLRDSKWFVFVRCGAFGLGEAGSSIHSHADQLAPLIYFEDRPLAVDCGTYGYLCPTAERLYFRSAKAHNTFTPDGEDQGEQLDVWAWARVPSTKKLESQFESGRNTVSGRMVSPNGFTHERMIGIDLKSARLEIRDRLINKTNAQGLTWRLHLAPGLEATVNEAHNSIDIHDQDNRYRMTYQGFTNANISDRWFSPTYGERVAIHCVELGARGEDVQTAVTIEAIHAENAND